MGSQTGGYSSYPLAPHDHSAPAQGGQLDPETALNPQPEVDFGDGSDGDVVCATGDVLARDMSFNNLTLNGAGALRTDGYKIKVRGKLTISLGRFLYCNGLDGAPGVAGSGGAAGGVVVVGRKPEACLPTSGAAGGNGGDAGVVDEIGGVAPDIALVNAATLFEGRLWAGAGGGGGGGLGAAPTAGGIPLRVLAGAKGGSGGDAITDGVTNRNFGGGGGGGGGGVIEIWAHEIDNAGFITASGGSGGAGQESGLCCAGGGGGGGGGAILIFYKILSGAGLGVRNVYGGGGGGVLVPGAAGAAGYSYVMKIGV